MRVAKPMFTISYFPISLDCSKHWSPIWLPYSYSTNVATAYRWCHLYIWAWFNNIRHNSLQWRHNERDGVSNVSIVCLTVCSGADDRKYQSSVSLAFVRGIHRWPVDSHHKGPVTQKMIPFDDVFTSCMSEILLMEKCANFKFFM